MEKRSFLLLIITLFFNLGYAQKITPEEYIERYKDVAITEMNLFGIPASITMAQACLESNFGNSRLAIEGNNHFGIKCHSSWTGKKIYKDDDKKNECFRHYNSVWESFRDHSKFLKNSKRYKFLFEYDITDYKKWAYGLKKAGYATCATYPEKLIRLIEKYKLFELDKYYEPGKIFAEKDKKEKEATKKSTKREKKKKKNYYKFSFNPYGRDIFEENRVKYIIVKKGDTPFKIAKEFEMMEWEIFKYNDLPKGAELKEGQRLYIQPKRCKAKRGNDKYVVKKGETLYEISQKFAIKLKCLLRKNNLTASDKIKEGDVLWLRKRKAKN